MRYNRRLGGLLGGATRFAPRLIDGMSSELRNNRLDIGVQNEIVCRTRESYEHGTWMTAFTTVRNAELKGETAEEHKYRIFLSSSVVVGRRPLASEEAKSRRSENDNDRNTTSWQWTGSLFCETHRITCLLRYNADSGSCNKADETRI